MKEQVEYCPSMDLPDVIEFLGQNLVRIPHNFETEDLYGICYKNEIAEVISPGDLDSCNFWSAELTFQGRVLRAHGNSLAIAEDAIRQQMETNDP